MAFENNVQGTLQANVAIGATTVNVLKAVAPNKDVPASGRLTLSATGKTEIITYTARTHPADSYGSTVTAVGGNFIITTVANKALTLKVGSTYDFYYPSGHPFRFSTTVDGTHGGGSEYTTGVTHNSTTHTTIIISASTPAALYYYCPNHSGMGGNISVVSYWTLTGVTKNAESSFGDQAWSAGDSFFQALTAADVASLQGATGPAGATGATGPAGATGATGPAGAAGAQGEFSFIGTLFTYSITAGSLVGSSGTVDIVDGDVFRLDGYNGNNNSFGDGLYVATNNFSVTKSQTQSVVNTALQNNFPSNFEVFTLDGADGAEGEFNFIGVLLNYSIGTGLGVGSGTLDVVDGDVFRLDGYTGVNNSFADGLFVATSNFTLTKSGTSSGVNTSLQSNFPSNFEVFTLDGATGADGVGGVKDFVATGTLPNGTPVILKADGTVEAVKIPVTTIAKNIPSGSSVIFDAGPVIEFNIDFDPNTTNTFVVTFEDAGNSNYGTAVVGTVTNSVITFGTPVVFNSGSSKSNSVSFDPNTAGKFIIAYRDVGNSYYGTVILGAISGTSISFGIAYVFSAVTTSEINVSFDPYNANKFLLVYNDGNGKALIGTVSGTSATFGSVTTFSTATSTQMELRFHPSQAGKFVVAYKTGHGHVVIATISGTNITFGTPVLFTNASYKYSVAFDPNSSNIVVAFSDSTNGNYGTVIVGAISGTTVTFGTKVVHTTAYCGRTKIIFDPYGTAGKFVICTNDETTNPSGYQGVIITGTISGTSATFGTASVFDVPTRFPRFAFNPSNIGEFVVIYSPTYMSNGQAIAGQLGGNVLGTTNLTADNFIGTSSAAYVNGNTASIVLAGGVSSNQTGLTTNSTYYVQTDGTLAASAGTPSVEAGRALSATSLLLTSEAGADGSDGSDGAQGVQGIQGTAGLGINFLGQVAATGNLPSGSNTQGDAYIVQADDSFHVWDGTSAWVSGGSIQGPQGVQGIQGIQGIQGTTGSAGTNGTDGADSTVAGPAGATGPAGTSALVLISQSTAPTSPALGQQWFDTSQGVLYEYLSDGTDSAWLDQGAANSTTSSDNTAEDAEILALIGL